MIKYFDSRDTNIILTHITDKVDDRGKVKGETYMHNRPVNNEDWENHFSGKVGLGLSPLLKNNTCKWAAIDVDIYPINIEDLSKKYSSLPLHFCRTKSGGLHIYTFFNKPKKSKDVIAFLNELGLLLEFSDFEVFPKQEKSSGSPNCINLPYFNKFNTNKCINYIIKIKVYT